MRSERKLLRRDPDGGWMGGYMTLETALMMPVIFFTVFMALYMAFHIHAKSCLAALAGERAISGHEQEVPDLMAAGQVSVEVKDSIIARKGEAAGTTFYYDGSALWSIKETRSYRKFRPVEIIRTKRAAKEAAKK